MMELPEIFEMQFITKFSDNFERSSRKITDMHTCDAEIIDVYPNGNEFFAITTDTIAEELQMGLYTDPYTIGWMAVVIALSDLAAVGANPLGMVISLSLDSTESDHIHKISQGISGACKQAGTYVLGGDTNFASQTSITGTAFGLVNKHELLTRCGMQIDDTLFVSGKLGIGNGLGISKFIPEAHDAIRERDYLPAPRLKEGGIIKRYASACMDTSDGFFSTLAHLVKINHIGVDLTAGFDTVIEERSLNLCQALGISPFVLLAGIHGEFELVFSIPKAKKTNFLKAAHENSWTPIEVGRCTEDGVCYIHRDQRLPVDVIKLSNLFWEAKGNLDWYIKELIDIGKQVPPQGTRG